MTEIALEREQDTQIKVPALVLTIVTALLMIFALWGSVSLLQWALNDKESKLEVVEASQITAKVRERQLNCLAKNIYYEAGGEPFEGKVAVAQVTLNRVDSNRVDSGLFPGDICQTIYQKNVIYEKVICQFSWTCDRVTGPKPINKATWNESMEVAKKVLLEGFRLPSLTNALYFHADYVRPNRPAANKVAHIGRHIFYR